MPAKEHHPATRDRDTGNAGATRRPKHPATTLPPDPQTIGHKMTPDEKVDEALLESMDGSDPPAYSAPATGSPKQRTSPAPEPDPTVKHHRAGDKKPDAAKQNGYDDVN